MISAWPITPGAFKQDESQTGSGGWPESRRQRMEPNQDLVAGIEPLARARLNGERRVVGVRMHVGRKAPVRPVAGRDWGRAASILGREKPQSCPDVTIVSLAGRPPLMLGLDGHDADSGAPCCRGWGRASPRCLVGQSGRLQRMLHPSDGVDGCVFVMDDQPVDLTLGEAQ